MESIPSGKFGYCDVMISDQGRVCEPGEGIIIEGISRCPVIQVALSQAYISYTAKISSKFGEEQEQA